MDGSGSTAGSNPIATYMFTFGDGTNSGSPSSTSIFSHTYSSPGTYTVTLIVTDTAGVSASTGATVTAVSGPNAVLSAAPTSVVAPVAVTADASGSTDSIGISSYTFDFGDGSPVVGPQAAAKATHTYTTAGNYTVTVTVTDTAQATSMATAAVAILAPPAAALRPDFGDRQRQHIRRRNLPDRELHVQLRRRHRAGRPPGGNQHQPCIRQRRHVHGDADGDRFAGQHRLGVSHGDGDLGRSGEGQLYPRQPGWLGHSIEWRTLGAGNRQPFHSQQRRSGQRHVEQRLRALGNSHHRGRKRSGEVLGRVQRRHRRHHPARTTEREPVPRPI